MGRPHRAIIMRFCSKTLPAERRKGETEYVDSVHDLHSEKHICLGELVEIDGKFAIRVKKPGKNDYEILTVENLHSIIFHTEAS